MKKPRDEQAAEQQGGIYEPKTAEMWKTPLTGKQIALRIMIAAAVVIIGLVLYFALSDAYERPIKKYYKGFQKNDAEMMAEAFPDWLRNADTSDTAMTVKAMCMSMISLKNLNYGESVSVNAGVIAKTKVAEEKLRQLEKGIEAHYHVSAKVTDGWDCTLAVTYRDSNGKETKNMEYATVYKIDGSWYMIDVANDSTE
ncbi:MAG: hypothetical protein IJ060_07570 [Oscillospiraceae bacterium]|nr:hypothetical protein [Oscillospiraceae bacterium]